MRTKVDIRAFPAAHHWPRDGGEYIGTCDAIITRDPDGGWLNVGTYRQMVQGDNQVGVYLSPGKDARLHIERYWSCGEPCEVVCCWGIEPALFIAASQTFPKTTSELDFVGGILGRPVDPSNVNQVLWAMTTRCNPIEDIDQPLGAGRLKETRSPPLARAPVAAPDGP